jgi:hypothetical protein
MVFSNKMSSAFLVTLNVAKRVQHDRRLAYLEGRPGLRLKWIHKKGTSADNVVDWVDDKSQQLALLERLWKLECAVRKNGHVFLPQHIRVVENVPLLKQRLQCMLGQRAKAGKLTAKDLMVVCSKREKPPPMGRVAPDNSEASMLSVLQGKSDCLANGATGKHIRIISRRRHEQGEKYKGNLPNCCPK